MEKNYENIKNFFEVKTYGRGLGLFVVLSDPIINGYLKLTAKNSIISIEFPKSGYHTVTELSAHGNYKGFPLSKFACALEDITIRSNLHIGIDLESERFPKIWIFSDKSKALEVNQSIESKKMIEEVKKVTKPPIPDPNYEYLPKDDYDD